MSTKYKSHKADPVVDEDAVDEHHSEQSRIPPQRRKDLWEIVTDT